MGNPQKQHTHQNIPVGDVSEGADQSIRATITSGEAVQTPPKNGASSRMFRKPAEPEQELTIEEAVVQMQDSLQNLNNNIVQIVKTNNGTIDALKALQGKLDDLQSHTLDLRKKEDREFVAGVADMTGAGEYSAILRGEKYEKEWFSIAQIKRTSKESLTKGEYIGLVALGAGGLYVAQQIGWIDLTVLVPSMGQKAAKK